MMIKRTFWLRVIEAYFKKRSVIWLYGPRRAGKTFLCRSIPGVEYFDCELPEIRQRITNPGFLESVSGKTIVLDEIHRIDNPSELLKIAADYHHGTKIIATGSSTLNAYKSFRDTLTGRKYNLRLTPMMSQDMDDFNIKDFDKRLLNGGLPGFLAEDRDKSNYSEWMESYWAKDVMELFSIEKRHSYLKFIELLMSNSGGIFEATSYAADCEISRHTVLTYLSAIELTGVVSIVRPYSVMKNNEIVHAPKIYGFDTGFVCYFKGWEKLRHEDYGTLWEHIVLNEFTALMQDKSVNYWRDKQGHELDFVIPVSRGAVDVFECKWSSKHIDVSNTKIFRNKYPAGTNYAVVYDCDKSYKTVISGTKVTILGLKHLREAINY